MIDINNVAADSFVDYLKSNNVSEENRSIEGSEYSLMEPHGVKLDSMNIIKRDSVFYGRVSSRKEAQLSALQNQMEWYDNIEIRMSEKINVVGRYIDEGITGTAAKKRPEFLKMIEDAKAGEFKLIITREVARFARNTEEALKFVKELRAIGVEVYFVNDDIWTFNEDSDLRLTIMAGVAQEEARKDSERVKAGIYIARQRGILWGNGNRYGYRREGKTFVLEPEQYKTCRMIGEWYEQGYGMKKIKNLLEINNRPNGTGGKAWDITAIQRILSDPFYAGIQIQNKSQSNGYLDQRRVKTDKSEYLYVKGDYPLTFTKEEYMLHAQLRQERSTYTPSGRVTGVKVSTDVWLEKLICNCGSRYRRYKWRTNKSGKEVIGYQCYNQVLNCKKSKREQLGLEADHACDLVSICQWKLEYMVKVALEELWTSRKEDVVKAYNMVKECYTDSLPDHAKEIESINKRIAKLKKRVNNLIEMRADDELSKEEFQTKRLACDIELKKLDEQLKSYEDNVNAFDNINEKLENIKKGLEELIDFSGATLPAGIVDKFIDVIVHKSDYEYDLHVNFWNEQECIEDNEIYEASGENKIVKIVEKRPLESIHVKQVQKTLIFSKSIGFEEAKAYKKSIGEYLRSNQWNNLTINVYV